MTTLIERKEDRVTGFLKWTDFSAYHESHTDGPDIKGGNNTELEGICRSVVE